MRGEEQLLENLSHSSDHPSAASWSAGDTALGWGWEAPRAESIPGSALMEIFIPSMLSRSESTNPSQGSGLAASLVPRSSLHGHDDRTSIEPQAPRMRGFAYGSQKLNACLDNVSLWLNLLDPIFGVSLADWTIVTGTMPLMKFRVREYRVWWVCSKREMTEHFIVLP